MKLQRMTFFLLMLLIFLLTSCASKSKSYKEHLFGVTKDSPPSSIAVIDWEPTYTNLANGVHVKPVREGSKAGFSTALKISVPPGNYLIYVRWQGVETVYRKGNTTIKNSANHVVPITVKPGMKYTLHRVDRAMNEKISVVETKMDKR